MHLVLFVRLVGHKNRVALWLNGPVADPQGSDLGAWKFEPEALELGLGGLWEEDWDLDLGSGPRAWGLGPGAWGLGPGAWGLGPGIRGLRPRA